MGPACDGAAGPLVHIRTCAGDDTKNSHRGRWLIRSVRPLCILVHGNAGQLGLKNVIGTREPSVLADSPEMNANKNEHEHGEKDAVQKVESEYCVVSDIV